jgi:membrane protein YqaA with SNARE-associated domain
MRLLSLLLANGWTAWIAAFADAPHSSGGLVRLIAPFGLAGLFLISIVDSSFVPLPVPGLTDILIVLLSARHGNLFLLIGLATVGSALGGLFSHRVGQSGGMAFLENHISPRIFHRVCDWMEHHAVLSVALPAVLPPPMPLSPFVLAAGALQMSRRKFMISFTVSRFLRHLAAGILGIYFGPSVLHIWNSFSRKWAVPILVGVWIVILISVGFAFWKLYKTSREVHQAGRRGLTSSAEARPT